EQIGQPIPDDLVLAPDPALGPDWIKRDDKGQLIVAEQLRWLVDFDEAVKAGMALDIALPAPWDTQGFDLLVALGTRPVTSAGEGVKRFGDLLDKPLRGDGCGIVRSGTPTNNTDTAMSGWQPASSELDQLFAAADNPPSIAPTPAVLGET